jgi:hypothetical protein
MKSYWGTLLKPRNNEGPLIYLRFDPADTQGVGWGLVLGLGKEGQENLSKRPCLEPQKIIITLYSKAMTHSRAQYSLTSSTILLSSSC